MPVLKPKCRLGAASQTMPTVTLISMALRPNEQVIWDSLGSTLTWCWPTYRPTWEQQHWTASRACPPWTRRMQKVLSNATSSCSHVPDCGVQTYWLWTRPHNNVTGKSAELEQSATSASGMESEPSLGCVGVPYLWRLVWTQCAGYSGLRGSDRAGSETGG